MGHGNSKRRLRAPRVETAMTSDLITTVAMIAHDPLVGGVALIAFSALISRMLFKQKPIWRAVARVIFLILLTLLLLHDGIVPYQPLQQTGSPYRNAIAGMLKIAEAAPDTDQAGDRWIEYDIAFHHGLVVATDITPLASFCDLLQAFFQNSAPPS